MLRFYQLILCLVYCHNSYFSVEKDEADDKVKRESGDSDGSDSDSDDDADVSKVCIINYKGLYKGIFISTANLSEMI